MHIDHLDHLVLTVADIDRSCLFYSQILGMKVITFNGNRKALRFGQQKINLHPAGGEYPPTAAHPTPGSADLCLIATTPLDVVMTELRDRDIDIIDGPVQRTGATGPMLSVYIRDPDGNLIEIANTR